MACVGRKAYESKTGKTSPATFTDVFYPRHVPGAVFFIFQRRFFRLRRWSLVRYVTAVCME